MPRLTLAPVLCALLLTACAYMPDPINALPWQDQQGDRGTGVRNRDWVQCSQAVETRRSAMADCMAQKGWAI